MKKLLTTLTAILAMGVAAACADLGPVGPSESAVTLLLTDAPGDFVSAVVTIDGVYLQGGAENDAEGDEDGRIWLLETPVTTDLLTLANDALTLVDGVEVPAGSYGQLRFVISGAYIEVEADGGSTEIYASQGYQQVPAGRIVDGALQMPSLGQSGLKVTFGGGLHLDDSQEVLLIDFDVAQSFGRKAGMSGMWVMNPVIKGAEIELTSSFTATVALADGVELPEVDAATIGLGDFAVVLSDDEGNTKEAALSATSGGAFTAEFPFLMPGATWSLDLKVPAGVTVETDPVLPLEVTTLSGESGSAVITVTAASAAGG